MADSQTTRELFIAKAVTDADINAAIEAYIADPSVGVMPIGSGYELDITAAVAACRSAPLMPATYPNASHFNRASVRGAILLARPVKA